MTAEIVKERQEVDPVFKQVVEAEFMAYQANCQTEYEVSRLPRKIDAFVTVDDETALAKIRQETPFFYLLRHSQLEFKGRRDHLTREGYHAIQGRLALLLHDKAISPRHLTATIISARKPMAVLKYARAVLEQPFVALAEKGYYKTKGYPPIYLIVVNELPIIAKNYALLIFAASQKKFQDFLRQVIGEGQTSYIHYAYAVRPQTTKEVLRMAGIASHLTRADLEFMANDIGQDLLAIMSPEAVLKGLDETRQDRLLALISPEKRLSGISPEDLLKAVNPEQRQRLLEALAQEVGNEMGEG